MKYIIALAQVDTVLGDLSANIQKHLAFADRARSGGADLVIFPELSLTGYSIKDANWDLAVRVADAAALKELRDASGDIAIIFGGIEESTEYGIHNSAFFAEKGNLTTVHRKCYLPTYGMFEEHRHFSPGKSVRAFATGFGRIGTIICEDMWHLPLPYLLAQDGAELIIGISASPTRLAGKEGIDSATKVNYEHHRTYARLLSTYVVFANRVGYEDGVNFWGGSEAVAPNGEVVARAKYFDEDIVFAEIDPNEIRRARRFSRHFLDDDPRLVRQELRRIQKERGDAT